MEINDKYYENIAIKNTHNYSTINSALDIVKKFIIREKKILVGGMSIDFALKAKGHSGIYDDDVLPDYDFYSDKHHSDAYKLAEWLYNKGFRDISVINALHPSTMKVRINFTVVADITYIHPHVLKSIPTLRYRGFVIIHPHVQMIDQHRSLSFPYENAPWETINSRPKKDMKRYDLLYEFYPLRMLFIKDKSLKLKKRSINIDILHGNCITGFLALNYWINIASNMGFSTNIDLGYYKVINNKLDFAIPEDSHGISIYTDNISDLYKSIKLSYNINEERFYNQFLDKLPKKVILDNWWELLDNDQQISAHDIGNNIYVANLQNVMMYLLVNYIILMKIKNINRGYSFYIGYLQCRDLIKWASNKYYNTTNNDKKTILSKFLPTAEYYGKYNLSKSYVVSRHNFDIKNKTRSIEEKQKYLQPSHVYDRDLNNGYINKSFYKFNPYKSLVFDFDGEEQEPFL